MAQPPTPKPERPTDAQALEALQNQAKPKPRPVHDPRVRPERPSDGIPSSAASGFVAMLAKGQIGNPHGTTGGSPKQGPVSEAEAARRGKYELKMAREIMPTPAPAEAPSLESVAAGAAPRKVMDYATVTRGYGRASPILMVLAGVLLLIGLWAIGALIYMAMKSPSSPADIGYPLLTWSEPGGYSDASHLMAWAMLACLPVGIVLAAASRFIRKRASRTAKL